jgi:hypothetical protein
LLVVVESDPYGADQIRRVADNQIAWVLSRQSRFLCRAAAPPFVIMMTPCNMSVIRMRLRARLPAHRDAPVSAIASG